MRIGVRASVEHWAWHGKSFEKYAKAGILLNLLLVFAYCIWTLDRGFEITDEAYYLLLSMHDDSVKYYISAQQWITSWIWQITGSLLMFRAAGLIILLGGAALLAAGVFSRCVHIGLVENRIESRGMMFVGAAIGALLYASTINFSPCYNLLASAGAYAAAGMVLLASGRENDPKKFASFVWAGIFVGVEFLCKASAGIATLALLTAWIVFFERSRSEKIAGPIVVALGVAMTVGVSLFINTTWHDASLAIEQGMHLFKIVQVEATGDRLLRYVGDYLRYGAITLFVFSIPVAAMAGFAKTRRVVYSRIGLIGLAISLLACLYVVNDANRYIVQAGSLLGTLLIAMIVSAGVWNKNRESLAMFAGLILLPYAISFGTGNTLFTQIIVSMAPWSVLVSILLLAKHPNRSSNALLALVGLCFMASITAQIVLSGMRPYHLTHSLSEQNRTVMVGSLGGLKVDMETEQFLADIQTAANECNILPGAPYLGLYNIPGVALVLQAIPVATPWLNNSKQAEFVLGQEPMPESAIVALNWAGGQERPELPRQLQAFPDGYRYCGMATYPYLRQQIQIWQSRAL